MKKSTIKSAAVLSAILILSASLISCGGKTGVENVDVDGAEQTSLSSIDEETSGETVTDGEDHEEKKTSTDETTKKGEEKTEEGMSAEDKSEKNKETGTKPVSTTKKAPVPAKKITLTSGLNSNDVSEVLAYYKLVAKKNAGLKMKKEMSLVSLDVGTLVIDGESDSPNREKGLSFFKKGANFALGFAGGKAPFPGDPSAIRVDDWASAKAVNDGTYTSVTVRVKTQTDSYNGKEYEGSVGRSMQVLAGFDTALNSINNVKVLKMTADFEHGDVRIEYQNPTIQLKVLNSTGELVKNSCVWSYRTKIYLNRLDGTMKVTKDHTVSIKDSSGAVDYSVKY
ncbi:MAG: hypothetical protein IJU39_01095 [Clostridia bacterium]|nr:hypothetical protein [Clostridia bacterium]